MTAQDLLTILDLPRRKTLQLLDTLEAAPQVEAVLGWRPGPGRAHIAWQLMHIAATDDRHLHIRMKGGAAREAELVRRFAGGSVPDDALTTKPNGEAQWTYLEWVQVLAWHEAHHHGQAHLTYNLSRSAHDPGLAKAGH